MPTAEHCIAMAEEAERLSTIVSYARDKIRLSEQAKSWRDKAVELAAQPAIGASPKRPRRSILTWMPRRRA